MLVATVAVQRWLGALVLPRRLLGDPRPYGVMLAAGGGLLVLLCVSEALLVSGVLGPVWMGYATFDDVGLWRRLFDMARQLALPLGALLVPLGLAGVSVLLKRGPGWVRKVARVGVALGILAVAFLVILYIGEMRGAYYGSAAPVGPHQVAHLGLLGGLLLVSAAALWVRGLGWTRGLGPVAWLLITPLPQVFIFRLYRPYEAMGLGGSMPPLWIQVLPLVPFALAGLVWVLMAVGLILAPKRERKLAARDLARTEARNLVLARRLYREAWAGTNLKVVDEVASAGMVDRYGAGRGPGSLKRHALALRKSFPDLRFEIGPQKAEGDEVATRWTASGTDAGGVLWYPATGRRAVFAGRFVDRFEDGRLVEHRGESDTADLLRQLGLPRA